MNDPVADDPNRKYGSYSGSAVHHLPTAWDATTTALPPRYAEAQYFLQNFSIHKQMLSSSGVKSDVRPLCYVRLSDSVQSVRRPEHVVESSSRSAGAIIASSYDKVERQLKSLASLDNNVEVIEEGAVKSALVVVDALRHNRLTPPALSWHGGDAIVMLWSIGDTTCAITVTDGELGYVIRRNRKMIKKGDSLKPEALKLADFA